MFGKRKKQEAQIKAEKERLEAEEKERQEAKKAELSKRYYEARVRDEEARKTKVTLVSSTKKEVKPEIYDKEETEKKTLVKTVKKNQDDEVISVKEIKPEETKEEVKEPVVEETKVEEPAEAPKEEVQAPVKEEKVAAPKETKEEKVEEAEDKKVKAMATKTKKTEDSNIKVLVESSPEDKTNGKYEIFHEAGGYRYRLVASNGQVLATSEVYTSAKGAQNGIGTLKSNLDKLIFRVETDKHRKSQFTASTQQNKLLVQSANYSSKTQAESAEESFKNFATATKIVLITEAVESEPELVDRTLFKDTQGKGKYVIVFNLATQGYQFSLKASNGQTIIASKFYNSESSAKNAISKFKNDVKKGTFYTIKDKNGMYEFRLYNESNRLVQSGIAFDSKAKCISNIESVVRFIDSPIENK